MIWSIFIIIIIIILKIFDLPIHQCVCVCLILCSIKIWYIKKQNFSHVKIQFFPKKMFSNFFFLNLSKKLNFVNFRFVWFCCFSLFSWFSAEFVWEIFFWNFLYFRQTNDQTFFFWYYSLNLVCVCEWLSVVNGGCFSYFYMFLNNNKELKFRICNFQNKQSQSKTVIVNP